MARERGRNMPAGILSTILDTTGERVKERISQTNEMDKQMRDTQTNALLNSIMAHDENGQPKLSPQEAEEAWGRIEKLHSHNKGTKDILAKARDITSKIFGGGQPNQAMAGRAQQQTVDALNGGQGGQLVGQALATPPPGPGGQATPEQSLAVPPQTDTGLPAPPARTAPAPAAPVSTLTQPPKRSTASLIQAGAPNPVGVEIAKEGRANKEFAERQKILHKNAMELASAKIAPKSLSYKGKDGKMHVMLYDPRDATVYGEISSTGDVDPARSWLSGAAIDAQNAKDRAARGEIFTFPDGTVIDTTNLQPNEELRAWAGGDAGHYGIYNQQTRQLTANNIVRTYPALNPSAQTVQGVARTGTTSTAEVPEINPSTNELNLLTTRQTSTPVTGAGPSPAQTAPPPAGAGPTPPPVRTEPPAAPAPAAPQSRAIPNLLPPAELDKQRQIATPVRAAAVQLFGDPSSPNIESMETFAKLADNPESRRRIGAAARFIINDLSAAEKSGGIGASILGEGASVQGGDIWSAIKNWAGVGNWLSRTQAEATENALSNLTPEEARALNQIMAAYGTVVGLRSLTRGGAYRFSVESMERELPIMGMADVNSSQSYYNKLAKMANEVVEGTKGVSDAVLPEKKFYKEAADRLNALGQGKTPPAPGALPSPPPRGGGAPQKPEPQGAGATGAGQINILLNGQHGRIPADQWDAFKAKYPTATREP